MCTWTDAVPGLDTENRRVVKSHQMTSRATDTMQKKLIKLLESAGPLAQLDRAEVKSFAPLAEAEVVAPRKVRVLLVTEGRGNRRDRNFYSRRAIETGAPLFEGARSFLNHQTDEEEEARPEQDIRELCGFFTDVKVIEVQSNEGRLKALEALFHPDASEAGRVAEAKAIAAVEFAKLYPGTGASYAGLSINASGVKEGTIAIEGEVWNNITGFANVRSVDVVTRPARGGAFVSLMESEAGAGSPNWRSKMNKTSEALKALRLAKAALKAETDDSKKKALEADVKKHSAEVQRLLEADDTSEPAAADPKDEKAVEPSAEEKAKKEAEEAAAAKASAEGEPAAADPADAAQDEELFTKLMQAVPRGAEEAEEAYKARLGSIKEMCGPAQPKKEGEGEPKKDDKAIESLSVADLKAKAPGLYSRTREAIRKEQEVKELDFKKLKESNSTLERELNIFKSRAVAEAKLRESNIPDSILAAEALVGKSGEEMDRVIESTRALMRGEGFGGEAPRGATKTREASAELSFDGYRIAKKETAKA